MGKKSKTPPDAEVDDLLVVPPEAVAPIKTSAQLRQEEEWEEGDSEVELFHARTMPIQHLPPARAAGTCGAAGPAASRAATGDMGGAGVTATVVVDDVAVRHHAVLAAADMD